MALIDDPAEAPPTFTSQPLPSDLSSLQPQAASGGMSESDARQQVLNRIASGEANSYKELYGGHQFNGYDDHPRINIPITSGPNVGKTSSAAGRYQFLAPTWDDEKRRLGLPDFSPSSQDAAAWDLADRTYRGQTGRSLLADAKLGNVQWSALGGTWESLQGVPTGPGSAKASWSGRSWPQASQGGQVAGGTGSTASTPAADPMSVALQKYALLRSAFPQHSLAPVSYDPWKYAPANRSLS